MDSVTVNSNGTTPQSVPKTEEVQLDSSSGSANQLPLKSEASPPCSDSSKESSPRPDLNTAAVKKEQVLTAAIERKIKKREDRNMDYVLRALSSLSTPEEKLAALCKKYTDLLDENRQHASAVKSNAKKLSTVSRERDSLQTENSKLILAKSKLENLCRELQRHNKVVKEESMARQREDEERRKEVSNRFQTTIGDIQTQMETHSKRNDQLQEDNKELTGKLHKLLEEYEKREEHIQKLLQQKDLETQLLEAKIGQCKLMIEKEQEKAGAEKQMLLEKLIESKTTQEAMAQTEVHLKTQLQIYTQKYAEFETTLNKSNEVFAAFKSEMEKMSKKIRKLEKESLMYKQRYENTNRALVEMVEQKTLHEKLIDTQTKKNRQLESLCRALQSRANGEGSATPTQSAATGAQSTDGASCENQQQNGSLEAVNGSSSGEQVTGSSTDEPSSVCTEAIGQSSKEPELANSVPVEKSSKDEHSESSTEQEATTDSSQSVLPTQPDKLSQSTTEISETGVTSQVLSSEST